MPAPVHMAVLMYSKAVFTLTANISRRLCCSLLLPDACYLKYNIPGMIILNYVEIATVMIISIQSFFTPGQLDREKYIHYYNNNKCLSSLQASIVTE